MALLVTVLPTASCVGGTGCRALSWAGGRYSPPAFVRSFFGAVALLTLSMPESHRPLFFALGPLILNVAAGGIPTPPHTITLSTWLHHAARALHSAASNHLDLPAVPETMGLAAHAVNTDGFHSYVSATFATAAFTSPCGPPAAAILAGPTRTGTEPSNHSETVNNTVTVTCPYPRRGARPPAALTTVGATTHSAAPARESPLAAPLAGAPSVDVKSSNNSETVTGTITVLCPDLRRGARPLVSSTTVGTTARGTTSAREPSPSITSAATPPADVTLLDNSYITISTHTDLSVAPRPSSGHGLTSPANRTAARPERTGSCALRDPFAPSSAIHRTLADAPSTRLLRPSAISIQATLPSPSLSLTGLARTHTTLVAFQAVRHGPLQRPWLCLPSSTILCLTALLLVTLCLPYLSPSRHANVPRTTPLRGRSWPWNSLDVRRSRRRPPGRGPARRAHRLHTRRDSTPRTLAAPVALPAPAQAREAHGSARCGASPASNDPCGTIGISPHATTRSLDPPRAHTREPWTNPNPWL